MKPMDPVADLIVRWLLAALFVAAAAHKLRDPRAFRAAVDGYRLVPASVVPAAAAVLPAAELALAAMLLGAASRPVAGPAAAALLGLYTVAIAANLARGRRDVDCGCLGPGHRAPLSERLVARNVVLGCGALLGLAPVSERPLGWLDVLTAGGATAVLAACWVATSHLLAVRPAVARMRSAA